MTIWQPGMRCVCVDASATVGRWETSCFGFVRRWKPLEWNLVKGKVYVVTDVVTAIDQGPTKRGEHIALVLADVPTVTPEGCFAADRFRPLCEGRLDQFRKHLDRIPFDLVPA